MPKIEKIFIGILAVALAILLFVVLNLKETYKSQAAAYEKQISSLDKRLTVISNVRAALQQALKKSIRKKTEYRLSLQDEIKRRELLDEQLKALLSEMATAKSQFKNLEDENYIFKKKIDQLGQEKDILNEKLALFKKIQEGLQYKIKRLLTKTRVELGQVVITPADLQGNILKTNKLYNFVIIDLGKNDGIKPGMNLMAYRNDKQIGEIIIEKVYDECLVGKAAFKWLGNELDVGDTVKGM